MSSPPQADPVRRTARAPVLFDTEAAPEKPLTPATAPPVPDLETGEIPRPEGRAMQTVMALAARRPSRLAKFFWSSLSALLGFILSVAIWDFVTSLLDRSSIIGTVALALVAMVGAALLLVVLKELAAFGRLRRLDTLHKEADAAIASHDLAKARTVLDHLLAFYGKRDDTRWGRQNLTDRRDEVLDADALLALTERELLTPLDTAATREIESAARSVATITALVPITLADLLVALTANLRMIRRIAEIYGGRGGVLGSIRLARSVLTHLVATGVVAVGDDMIGSIAGGGVVARVSRRFGEGVVNGALTTRVGIAAMEVCRPLPFRELKRPSVSAVLKRALAGVFRKAED
nr:TIGR01620 family protein [Rhodovulum sp. P5]